MRRILIYKKRNCNKSTVKHKGLCREHQRLYNRQFRLPTRKQQIKELVLAIGEK